VSSVPDDAPHLNRDRLEKQSCGGAASKQKNLTAKGAARQSRNRNWQYLAQRRKKNYSPQLAAEYVLNEEFFPLRPRRLGGEPSENFYGVRDF
jgi:hypothetical protein